MTGTIINVMADCSEWYTTNNNIEYICKKAVNAVFNTDSLSSETPNGELGIMLTTDQKMCFLNNQYRGKNEVTNVLSFSSGLKKFKGVPYSLGDIAIGYKITLDESVQKAIPFIHHVQHLLIHGCLHLLAFNHQTSKEAEKMENIEISILRGLDIPNPYQP
jgi:probable rRNA maturation factor